MLAWMIVLALPAAAHNGPPFPIITDQRVGPCVLSLWVHPDIGTSPFFVLVNPPSGASVPDDLRMKIGVQPESGRLAEVVYPMWREKLRGQIEFKAEVQFDAQEFWRIRLVVDSSQGGGEALSRVEATPTGFGQWDLLLYLLPFLAVGFLVFRGMAKKRGYRKRQAQAAG
jgi:hypothetical protein